MSDPLLDSLGVQQQSTQVAAPPPTPQATTAPSPQNPGQDPLLSSLGVPAQSQQGGDQQPPMTWSIEKGFHRDFTPEQQAANQAALQNRIHAESEQKDGLLGIPNATYGSAKGLADLVQAPLQIAGHVYNGFMQNYPNPQWNPMHNQLEAAKGTVNQMVGDFDNHLKNQEENYQEDTQGKWAGAAGIGRYGASAIPFLETGGAAAAPQAASKLGAISNFAKSAAATSAKGAVYGVLTQPVTDTQQSPNGPDNFFDQKARQAGYGAIGGLAGATAGKIAGAFVKPNLSPEVQKLVDEGITLTPGQIMGGAYASTESKLTSVLILGDMIHGAQQRALQDFNRAAVNRSLAPIGESLPVNMEMGHDAIDYASQRLGNAYDTVLDRIKTIMPDTQFHQDISNLGQMVQNLPAAQSDQFNRIVANEITNRIKGGYLTTDAMKAAESNLGAVAKNLMNDKGPTAYDSNILGTAVQEVQASLRGMVARQNPDEAAALQKINQGWANYLRVQRAASSVGSDSGVFTPAQLQNSVKALDPSKNKGDFAKGKALMQDLSDAGKVAMPAYKDSGTAGRMGVMGPLIGGGSALAGAAIHDPGMVAPMATGIAGTAAVGGLASLPYTEPGQQIVNSILTKRPQFAGIIRNAIQANAPVAGAATTAGIINGARSN